MKIIKRLLEDVLVIQLERREDARGSFTEIFSERSLEELGIRFRCVQDNSASSKQKGTVRGLHYQKEPYAQNMLMSCTKGEIAVLCADVRQGSPSFGKCCVIPLCEGDDLLVYMPKGHARGTAALKDNSAYTFKVDAFYNGAPENNGGLSCFYDAGQIPLEELLGTTEVILSERDRNGLCRTAAELPADFVYRKG